MATLATTTETASRRSPATIFAAIGAVLLMFAASAVLLGPSAGAQVDPGFSVAVSSSDLPGPDGSSEVTVSVSPMDSTVAALSILVTFDETTVEATECVSLVGLGACATATAGEVEMHTVDGSGWQEDTDLFTISLTGLGLAESAALNLEIVTAYDVEASAIIGEETPGSLDVATRGDVNCSGGRDIIDALVIAQYDTAIRTAIDECPLVDNATDIFIGSGDMNDNGTVDIIDALLIARCVTGVRFDCDY